MNARKLAEEARKFSYPSNSLPGDEMEALDVAEVLLHKAGAMLDAQAALLERIREILNDDDEDQPTYAIAEVLRAYDKLQEK